ncbi:MAG: putative FAD-linked oxidoreductase [Promethearchaeota archaeon]|nr:MAG: putative FAD-linked oxidoreductase [Candidatus Lokiarchaeota archaeon]
MGSIENAYEKIEDIVGTKYTSISRVICYSYSMNCDTVLQGIPDIVVRPKTSQEISEILRIANQEQIRVIPRGGGADLTGGSKPIGDGGIVLDLTRMNKVLDIDLKNYIVTVEVGISWSELCKKLSTIESGYYTGSTGPASGFSATVGGGLSNNSVGGGGAAMYGNVTEQCVGLEVVLPTGEIIYTGAKANSFCEKPFTRFGLGPDYSGIFLGDVGIHGIKTKASLNLYPLPEYAAYSTYDITTNKTKREITIATEVMTEWQHRGYPLHDFYYYTEGYTKLLTMFQIKKNLANANVQGSILFYTTTANSQKELEHNVEKIEKVASKENMRKLGDTIGEGNLGKWFYEENGRWQWAHIYWGLYGPEGTSLGTCLKCPTYQLPEYVKLYEKWSNVNTKKLWEIGGGGANFIAFGCHPSYIDVTGGLAIHSDPTNRKVQFELWKDMIISQIKELGGIHYWMGEIIGRSLVDSGALTPEYYNFMITLKKALDPNKILSPGKFYLGEKY